MFVKQRRTALISEQFRRKAPNQQNSKTTDTQSPSSNIWWTLQKVLMKICPVFIPTLIGWRFRYNTLYSNEDVFIFGTSRKTLRGRKYYETFVAKESIFFKIWLRYLMSRYSVYPAIQWPFVPVKIVKPNKIWWLAVFLFIEPFS